MQVKSSDDDVQAHSVNNTVQDAFGVQETNDDKDKGAEGPMAEYFRNEATIYLFELMSEADKSLYPGIILSL